jgi:hypothetical protein
MSEFHAVLLSDHLMDALRALNEVREIMGKARVEPPHYAAVLNEVTQAELAIARVIGLVAGAPSHN